MEKSAYLIQGALFFYLLLGMSMAIIPEQTHHAQKTVLRSLRLISEQTARKSLSQKARRSSRIVGIGYIVACLVILTQMKLQVGKIAETPMPPGPVTLSNQAAADAQFHQLVNDVVQPLMRKHVGIVIVTIADEQFDISAFGRVHLKTETPPDKETLFEIGSLSKVFTGIVLAAQVHNNKLTLQTPLASLLPALGAFPDSRVQRITLEQLATHTAGLPRMPSGAFRPVNIWKTIIASDSYRAYTEQDVLAVIPRKTSREPSDLRFRYSNAGFGLLGMILSEESGMTYHDLIQTTIANPLGLKDTGVMLDEEQHARVAAGYRSYLHLGSFYLAQRSALWDFPNCMAGAGGIRSSAADMLVFLNALLGRTRTELTPVFQESQNILFTNKEMQIGMGWFHATLPASGESIIWHNGGTGGYSSFLGLTANKRFGVCVLSNSARSVDDIGYRILDALITS